MVRVCLAFLIHFDDSADAIERNANGKVTKLELKKRVRKEWARRLKPKAQQPSPKARQKPKPKL